MNIKRSKTIILELVIPLSVALSAQAATDTWTAGDSTGLWNDPLNWLASTVPSAGDTVNFTNTYNAQSVLTLNTSYPSTGTVMAALNFNYGANLAITNVAGNYLYVNTVNVNDANTYTLDVASASANEGLVAYSTPTTFNVATGGTLDIQTSFTAKSGVTSGSINKTGTGTLELGDGTAAATNSVTQYLQLNAEAGLTKLGFISGAAANGISAIAAGATVQIISADTSLTAISSAYSYLTGVAGVSGTFDLNGYNENIFSLAGTATGVVTDSGTANSTLTLGISSYARTETSGTFAGVIKDGSSATMSLALNPHNTAFTETLSGANTYSGSTTVNVGALKAGVASVAGVSGAFGKNSAVTMANAASANLNLNGFNTQIGSLTGGGTTGGSVTNGGAVLTVGGDNTSPAAYAGVIYGTGGLAKIGAGTLTLSGANVYSGNTTISGGTLALSGSGSIASTPLISVGGGAALNVSGLLSAFTLGGSQTLSNNAAATGGINGSLNTGSGTVSLSYASGTPSLSVTNGTLTLSSSTVFNLNNTGVTLPLGSYLIISTNAGGLVAGTVPTVTISGGGVAAGWGLAISNAQLYLNVFGRSDNWTGGGSPNGNWSTAANWGGTAPDAAGDSLTFLGSSQSVNTNNSVTSAVSVQLNTSAAFTIYGNPLTILAGLTNSAGNNTWNIPLTLPASQDFDVASGTVLTLGAVVSGGFGLTKTSAGTLTLAATDTYSGNTTISSGTLVLSGSGSIANTPLISLGGGATLDVSGLSSAFTLGGGQTLANSAPVTGLLNGSLTTGSGAVSLTYASGTPSLSVANGTLTLSSGTALNVNNTGATLPIGSYTIISTTGGGLVAGTPPAVTVNGNGAAARTSLLITNGQLDLIVYTESDTWTGGGSPNGNWSNPTNWGGAAPGAVGDSLIFTGSAQPVSTNDYVTSASSLELNPGAAFTFYGNAVTIDDGITNAAENNTINNNLGVGGNVDFDVASGTTLTLNGVVSGGAGLGLTETSAGTLDLANTGNTFGGPLAVTAGTLELGDPSATSTYVYPGSELSVVNAALWFNGSSGGNVTHTYTFPNLTGPVDVTNSSLTFQTSNTATKNVDGGLDFGGTNSITYVSSAFSQFLYFNGPITGNGTVVFNWNGSATGRNFYIQTNGNFSGTAVLGVSPSAGNFNLNYPLGPASFVVSNDWTLVVATNNLDGAASVSLIGSTANLTFGSSSYGWNDPSAALILNAGTVTLGNGPTSNQALSIGSLSGAGGTINNNGSSATTLTVNQTASGAFAGVIGDDGNPLALIQNGPATLALSGANTYSGNTTVNAGVLEIDGSLASPAVTVNSGGALSGSGTVSGTTTVDSGGAISVNGSGVLGLNTLALGASPSDNTTLTFQGNGTTLPSVAVAAGGGFANYGTATVNITGALPSLANTTYTLLTYSGAISGAGSFVLGTLGSGLTGYITNNTTDSALELVVTGASFLRWAGSPTNDWDLLGNNDWVLNSSGLPTSYQNGEAVTFNDSAANFTVNVAAVVTPGGVIVSNNVNNYSFVGSGGITGVTPLTKNGTGTLTMATANSYSGQTIVNNGVLQLGDGTANNGTVSSSIADNAAVVFANPTNQTYAGVISGSGTVAKQSAGTLVVSGNNTYSGGTAIGGGTLVVGSSTALGAGGGQTTVSSGTLDLGGQNLGAETVTISGAGVGGNGAVVNSGGAQVQAVQYLALSGNATVGGANAWAVNNGNAGSGATVNLAGMALTKTGSNLVELASASVSDGNLIINQGQLELAYGLNFPAGTGQITVNPAGILELGDYGFPLQVSQPITLNGSSIQSDPKGTTATLNSPVNLTANSVVNAGVPTYFTGGVSGSGLLTVGGGSTLVLDAPTNTWNGGLVISNGATLQLGNNDANGSLPPSVLVVTNNGLLAYSLVNDFTFNQAMVGIGGFEQAGSDNITMTNRQTYVGPTVLASGTLTLAGGNNTLSNVAVLNFVGDGTLNVGTNSQAVSGLTINNNYGATIGNGSVSYVSGAGALTVIGANALLLGPTNTYFDNLSGASEQVTLNMSGLNSFSYNNSASPFSVGGLTTPTVDSVVTLNLALTNDITASQFGVANDGGYPGYTSTGTVTLGNTNAINANTLSVGYANEGFVANGTLEYAGASSPTLKIRAADGVSRANVYVGYLSASDYAAGTGVLDLYDNINGSSTLDALVGSLVIGQHNYGNVNYPELASGTFIMGNGLLDAANIVIGQKTVVRTTGSTYGTATGVFTLYGGTVNVQTMTIGDEVSFTNSSVSGEFDLNGGTLFAQIIQAGNGLPAAVQRTFNWNGGVIANYANSGLNISGLALSLNNSYGTPTFSIAAGQSGTVSGGAIGAGAGLGLNGSTSIAKTGSGTLSLEGDHTGFSGTLTNEAGTLYVDGPISGAVEDFAGATLAGTNAVVTAQIDNGGTVQAGGTTGAGVLTSTTLNLGVNSTDATYSQFTVGAGGQLATTTLNVNGTNLIQIRDASLTVGTNTLFTYSTLGGSRGFGGFKLGTLPAGVTASLLNTGSAVQLAVTSAFTVNTNPPVVTAAVSGNTLTISWPSDHLGWRLLAQTNSLSAGLGTNWVTVPNSTTVTSVPMPINPANPTVFFQLVYP